MIESSASIKDTEIIICKTHMIILNKSGECTPMMHVTALALNVFSVGYRNY